MSPLDEFGNFCTSRQLDLSDYNRGRQYAMDGVPLSELDLRGAALDGYIETHSDGVEDELQ